MKKYKCKLCGEQLFRRSSLRRYELTCVACCYNYKIEVVKKNITCEVFEICEKFCGEAGILTVKFLNSYETNECLMWFHEGTKFEFCVKLGEIYEIKSIEESIKFFKTYAKNTMLL